MLNMYAKKCFQHIWKCSVKTKTNIRKNKNGEEKNQTKKGIASSLLSNIYSFCINNGIIKILLEVRKSNIIAQNLYEKQGFKKISERKKYYDNIEDAYIYEKEL